MSKPEPIDALSDDERKLLIDALTALRQCVGRLGTWLVTLPTRRESANRR